MRCPPYQRQEIPKKLTVTFCCREEAVMSENSLAASYSAAIVKAADNIDRLVSLDFGHRGKSEVLYEAARKVQGAPLTLLGADLIQRNISAPGQIVLIITGGLIRPDVEPSMGEMDGPPGAAILARGLAEVFGVLPVVLTDKTQSDAVAGTIKGGGLRCLPVAQARSTHSDGYKMVCGLISDFPLAHEEKEENLPAKSQEILNELSPRIVVFIERGGFNEKRVYHNSRGKNVGTVRSKMDYMALAAAEAGIPTIGIGDGGNEIGMGLIREQIRPIIPFGEKCQCPCEGGIVTTTSTTVLIIGHTSNWGAYGLIGALSLTTGNRAILHTPEEEAILLRAAVDSGLVDGREGPKLYYDDVPLAVNQALIELMRYTVEHAEKNPWVASYQREA